MRSDASSGESGHDSVPSAWNIPGGHPRGDRPTDSRSDDAGVDDAPARAEALLLRKLRSRSLSLSEARTAVRGVDGVDETVVEDLIARFVDLGYLDDAAFAEQLAMSAVEKRGEGRRAVAETLRKRGIPRDIAEAALAELPDDDAERALEFARSKVRGVEGKDYEASLRRLAGQLARRGYPSSVALSAAKTALSEAGMGRSRSFGRPASGVRFTPDD
ncbi:regulatory protein RecX [Microbacterium sp. KSW2-29]|uniref:Regulatory protein RecX n=1 Tax=Microbacterium phycohabitans TaxID=3075993 RepID=A0ABU3SHG8_9MICO|nr:regulatory protein RecX [Microbacterium sp. KSW2-29]MDU0344151.1 regulatory protein RecX [Microbacterium sp. KSW2-29]